MGNQLCLTQIRDIVCMSRGRLNTTLLSLNLVLIRTMEEYDVHVCKCRMLGMLCTGRAYRCTRVAMETHVILSSKTYGLQLFLAQSATLLLSVQNSLHSTKSSQTHAVSDAFATFVRQFARK